MRTRTVTSFNDVCHFSRPTYLLGPLVGDAESARCCTTTVLMMCSSCFQLQNSALSAWAVVGWGVLHFIAQADHVKLFRLFFFCGVGITLAMFPDVSVTQKHLVRVYLEKMFL